jgi:hypothetical protein
MTGRVKLVTAVAVAASGAVAAGVATAGGGTELREQLTGYEEVPAVSTKASGRFQAKIPADRDEINYRLRYRDLEGAVTQAHIHFGQRAVNGGISVFLCSNLGNGPAGTQACPAPPATIEGTIVPNDVIGPGAQAPGGQGIAPGEFDELVRAIEAGVTYANVHSSPVFTGGEIRAQLKPR